MNTFSTIFSKVKFFLERLSSQPQIGGLYISNLGIQYVEQVGKVPKTYSLRFPPGIMRDGHIQDIDQFKNTLLALHQAVASTSESEFRQIVVVLPSSLVYTQSFSIPNVGDDNLQESALLNLQTISPLPVESTYMNWQILEEAPDHYDLLGAFVESKVVDAIEAACISAFFRPIAFEFPSISISRLLSKAAHTKEKYELLLQVSSDGINISILKRNKIYFDYFRSWYSIQGEEGQISKEKFSQIVIEETRKVMNFSISKFKEKIVSILLIAPGFEDAVRTILKENFSVPVETLTLPIKEISPLWYVPFGAGMREIDESQRDEYINLAKKSSEDLFFQEHIIRFVRLWRAVLGIVLGFFLIIFLLVFSFVESQKKDIEKSILTSKSQFDPKELSFLASRAERFNALVGAVGGSFNNADKWNNILSEFLSFAQKNNISIRRIDITSLTAPTEILAVAPNNTSVIAFKNALIESGLYTNVTIPLLSIKELDDGSVGFTLSFSLKK